VWCSRFCAGLRRLLELLVLRLRSERTKEIEMLVLRHQLQLLERQVARPQLRPADRALLAAFSRALPRQAWTSFLVSPARLLRWHRELVARRWTYPGRRPGRPRTPVEVRELVVRLASRESGLGLSAHPGRAGRAWHLARAEHGLGNPAPPGDRACTASARLELATVSAPAGGEHHRVRLPHRRHRVPEALLHPLLHRISAPSRSSGRNHGQS
jgi:hypothetical protein